MSQKGSSSSSSSSVNSDLILDILGNDTRRKILTILSREPMYFNQLAKEIGVGQQAILRHLHALEDSGLVETYAEKSDLGAPDRKYYRLNRSFVLTVSLSEDDFTVTNKQMVELRHKESRKYYRMLDSLPQDTEKALTHLHESLVGVEQEISNLEERLSDLRALKQLILHKLHEIDKDNFEQKERYSTKY